MEIGLSYPPTNRGADKTTANHLNKTHSYKKMLDDQCRQQAGHTLRRSIEEDKFAQYTEAKIKMHKDAMEKAEQEK